jgi:hypothetical protein
MTSPALKKIKRMYAQGHLQIEPYENTYKITRIRNPQERHDLKTTGLWMAMGFGEWEVETTKENDEYTETLVIPTSWLNKDRREAIETLRAASEKAD